MKPPEKIFIVNECCHCPHHAIKRAVGIKDIIICTKLHEVIDVYTIPENCPLEDYPVWRDAVKEPPKEGKYLVAWKGGHWNTDAFWDGKWFNFPNVPPDYYMTVIAPERSGE
jgi:hypothetical protein